jgi:hypothetical protein
MLARLLVLLVLIECLAGCMATPPPSAPSVCLARLLNERANCPADLFNK